MSKFNREAINASDQSLPKRALHTLGRVASGAITGTVAPVAKSQPAEAISFFDAPAPELPSADVLDRLDAIADEEIIASKMSRIEIHRTDA